MKDNSMSAIYGSVEILNKWKLMRLGKVVDMGWEEFARGYLKPLYDKNTYLRSFLQK